MPLTKRVMAPGEFDIELVDDVLPVPHTLSAGFDIEDQAFGQVLVLPARVDPFWLTSAQMYSLSVYTGVYYRQEDRTRLRGHHASVWLGDPDGKGYVLEVAVSHTGGGAASFATWIGDLRPGTVTAGTVGAPAGTLDWVAQYQSRRQAIDYVCDYFSAEWEVTDDLKLNADVYTSLYGSTPGVILTPLWDGRDPELRSVRARFGSEKSAEDWTSKVIVKEQGGAVGTASGSTPFKDGQGNAAQWKRYIDGSADVVAGSGGSVASGQLAKVDQIDTRLTCRSDAFCPMADVRCGELAYAFDPERDVWDPAGAEVHYGGGIMWPTTLRVRAVTMALRRGMGLYFRDGDGNFTDLSDFFRSESSESVIEVGAPGRILTDAGSRRLLR